MSEEWMGEARDSDYSQFRRGPRFHAAVIVQKKNPKTSNKESIRFEPDPPLDMETLNEAKHWAATYALYRFCNNIQLNRVLPPGPREYWQQIAEVHRLTPEHLKWHYDPDPFAAKAAQEERQRKAAALREKKSRPETADEADLGVFDRGMEVKMATGLRDTVEAAVKKTLEEFPETNTPEGPAGSYLEDDNLIKTLSSLGFKSRNITTALEALSSDSPFTTALLSSLPPLEAALEFLLLHIPESDLPPRFAPSKQASDPFVSSAHTGNENLEQRWMEDRAVKDAGYPRLAVKTAMESAAPRIESVFEILARKLVDFPPIDLNVDDGDDLYDEEARKVGREGELEAVQSVFPNASFDESRQTLSIPFSTAPATFNIIYPTYHPYPEGERLPPFFISSPTLPPYLRLHLTAEITRAVAPGPDGTRYTGESICFNAIEVGDTAWQAIEENGPPDLAEVLKHLMPPRTIVRKAEIAVAPQGKAKPQAQKAKRDTRSDKEVLEEFERLQKTSAYQTMEERRKELPAWNSRGDLVKTIRENQVVIVVGETGCGKTTQLPQFVLDSEIQSNKGSSASIIITQPRRVSVLGVSSRVSAERADDGSVGYSIRGESRVKATTKLLFCTTGVLLRRLSGGDTLDDVTHVVVDEVHERSVDSDFLLLELKEMIKLNTRLKVILMSATINHNTFSEYFGGAPVMEIPGRTFPVEDFYLEDIIPTLKYRPTIQPGGERMNEEQLQSFRKYFENAGVDKECVSALEVLKKSDRIDFQLVAAIVRHITSISDKGAILVFMPGVQEIRQCIEALQSTSIGNVTILPLHANLSSDEQRRVFAKTSSRKIVVSTNVAETSITIDDVIYVVDGGKAKEIGYDHETGLSRLEEELVTRASANQRRGRAGRTQPGKCYKMFTKRDEENMRKFPVPEMQRVPLESLSLQVKATRPDEDVKLYLGRAIDPPKVAAMEKAWSTLEDLGAIDPDGNLAALGRYMAMLPVDLRLGKMLILATLFGCLSPILTIAACLSSKPLFVSPMDKREESNKARTGFSSHNSDLLTAVTAFEKASELNGGARRSFCEENFISFTALRDIASLRLDFLSSLSDIGFIPLGISASDPRLNRNNDNINLVKAIITGGLWPHVVKVVLPKAMFDRVAAGSQQREHQAKEVKYFDESEGRVFLHPSSTLFVQALYKSRFLAYFTKVRTSKIFLRDVTEIPVYGLLLFGGRVQIKHVSGELLVGKGWIKLKAAPRIGVLVNQLRRLLDAQMDKSIETATLSGVSNNNPIVDAMLALLIRDGMSPDSI